MEELRLVLRSLLELRCSVILLSLLRDLVFFIFKMVVLLNRLVKAFNVTALGLELLSNCVSLYTSSLADFI